MVRQSQQDKAGMLAKRTAGSANCLWHPSACGGASKAIGGAAAAAADACIHHKVQSQVANVTAHACSSTRQLWAHGMYRMYRRMWITEQLGCRPPSCRYLTRGFGEAHPPGYMGSVHWITWTPYTTA